MLYLRTQGIEMRYINISLQNKKRPYPLNSLPLIVNCEKSIEKNNNLFPRITQQKLAWMDIADGIFGWRIWSMLAYQDIKLRYRRSVLGPFWITLSMAITVYTMGFLYANLFHIELDHYFPFLVAGMLSWSLISSLASEYTDGLLVAEGLIKQIKLPYTLYIHRIAARNIFIFFTT